MPSLIAVFSVILIMVISDLLILLAAKKRFGSMNELPARKFAVVRMLPINMVCCIFLGLLFFYAGRQA